MKDIDSDKKFNPMETHNPFNPAKVGDIVIDTWNEISKVEEQKISNLRYKQYLKAKKGKK